MKAKGVAGKRTGDAASGKASASVSACTAPTRAPVSEAASIPRSLLRISPAARDVNVTASTCPADT